MGFSRQEYWSGLPSPSTENLPDPGIKPASLRFPALADGFFTNSTTWEAPWGLSVQLSRSVVSNSLWPHGLQHARLSITNSRSLLKLMSIKSVMWSNHLILCRPLLSCIQSCPASGSFPMSQFFASGGQSIRPLVNPKRDVAERERCKTSTAQVLSAQSPGFRPVFIFIRPLLPLFPALH